MKAKNVGGKIYVSESPISGILKRFVKKSL